MTKIQAVQERVQKINTCDEVVKAGSRMPGIVRGRGIEERCRCDAEVPPTTMEAMTRNPLDLASSKNPTSGNRLRLNTVRGPFLLSRE